MQRLLGSKSELMVLSRNVIKNPISTVKKLTDISNEFICDYKRKFRDELISESEAKLMEEFYLTSQDIDFDMVLSMMNQIDLEFASNREILKGIVIQYSEEKRYNYGDRLLEIADIMTGSFQSGLCKKEILHLLRFAQQELITLSGDID